MSTPLGILTEGSPPSAQPCLNSSRTKAVAMLSPCTLSSSLPWSVGIPMGCSSARSGPGALVPSAKTRGISRTRLFVEQSRAAAMKHELWSCVLNDFWRWGLDKS